MNDDGSLWSGLDARGFDQLFSMLSDAAFIDQGGRIVAVNAAGAELYGTTVAKLVGTATVDLVPEQYRPHIDARVERLRAGVERDRWAEEEILRIDGDRRAVGVRSHPVSFNGDPAALVLIRDISELRHVEGLLARRDRIHRVITDVTIALALASDEELDERIDDALRAIGEASGVDRAYVTTYSADGRWCTCAYEWVAEGIEAQIDYVQDLPLEGFEWTASRIMAGHVLHIPELDRLPDEAANERASFGRYDVRSLLVVPLVAGSDVTGDVGFNVVRRSMVWPEDEIDLLRNVASVIGMSLARREAARQSREARDAAIQANAAKDVFLSRMSHELRTPLNAVLGFTELLLRTPRDDRDRAMLEQVLASGRHLLHLVEDVLDISRIVAGGLVVSMEPVALDDVLGVAVDMVTQAHTGELPSIVLEPTGLMVLADRQRLQQVMVNLVGNGIKYNRPGGAVTIVASRVAPAAGDRAPEGSGSGAASDALAEDSPGRIRVEVRDTGIGIPADALGRVFEPFDRLGRETSGVDGVGIGLTLTRSLVEAMGGTIGVESEEGSGSTFWFELFEADPAHAGRRGGRSVPSDAPVVLCVEDNEVSRIVVRQAVERCGCRHVEAESAMQGFAMAVAHSPALVIVDLHLVDSTGHELVERLRATPATRHIPVVVVSANESGEAQRRLAELGVEEFLHKPVAPDDLAAVVTRLVGSGDAAAGTGPGPDGRGTVGT